MKSCTFPPSKSILASLTIATLTLTACGGNQPTNNTTGAVEDTTETEVQVDGSSTVVPMSKAMANEFTSENREAGVTVAVSGSGRGFEKFCAGLIDVANASRPIQSTEMEKCQENGIKFIELPIALDGISVLVNSQNDWASCLTIEELKTIWEPAAEGQITNWSQVRNEFPDRGLSLYAPGTASGTFDYFTKAIVGESGASRRDYTASVDDNVLVQGVANEVNAMTYFGYAYYQENQYTYSQENQDKLKLLAIDSGNGCVQPSPETIADGSYQPLSRPLFIYVNKESLENKPQVREFAQYHLEADNTDLISEVGYVPLTETMYQKVQNRLSQGTTGSMFEGGSTIGVHLAEEL